MPWLVLDHLGVGLIEFVGILFLLFVAPSLVGAVAGTWIMWGKDRSLFLGFLMGFAIGAGGTAISVALATQTDLLETYAVGMALAVAALVAIARYLPKGKLYLLPGPIAPPKPDRSNPHQ